MAKVRFEQVEKQYGGVAALAPLSLEAQDGELLAIVGPSGCGKSTLLRLVAGLDELSAGHLYIGDRRVDTLSPQERDVAMVFQSYALYPHKTVFENIAFGLRLRKVPDADVRQRVQDVAALLELGELLSRYPRQLSGGQRQRVAMGRAIVRQPAVFLFDEPLSNLDARLRHQVRAEIARLHQRLRTTTLYVTHDQLEAMTLADRIAVLDHGQLQQVGRPLELYASPKNRFVAAFIGSPQMNFLALSELPAPAPAWMAGAVEVGIRPEHLRVADTTDVFRIKLEIELVEPLGAEQHVSGRSGSARITVRLSPELSPKAGESLWLSASLDKVQAFAADGTALRRA